MRMYIMWAEKNGFKVKGVHRVSLDALRATQRLQKGTYFLQMEFGQRKMVQKLIMDF